MKPTLTYEIAMAAGQDAGNRNMRKHHRIRWNLEDRNIAAAVCNDLLDRIDQNDPATKLVVQAG